MLRSQKGFTLIELVMIIVILGLLAAVAVPKYQDLRTDAIDAAAEGVFGAANGATAVNFASRLLSPTRSEAIDSMADLILAMEGTPEGWTAGTRLVLDTDTTYFIRINTTESPINATAPTRKAVIHKSW